MRGTTGIRNRWPGIALATLLAISLGAPATASERNSRRHWWQGAQAREAETFRWSGRVSRGTTLEVHGINGNVHAVLAGGGQAKVEAVRRGRKDDPEDVKIEVIEQDGKVIVCARYPNPSGGLNDCSSRQNVQDCDVTVEFTLEVPAGVTFEPRTVNGSIEAEGLEGPVFATTVNGSIDLSTTGPAEAHTVNGSITARMGAPASEDLEFETVNGRIALELPRDADADLDARVSNGSIRSDLPLTMKSSSRHSGYLDRRHLVGTIGDGGARLRMATVNGSIALDGY